MLRRLRLRTTLVLTAAFLVVAGPASAQETASAAASAAAPTAATSAASAGGTASAATAADAGAPEKERDPVEELFVQKCASCHTVGQGARIGPDLKDVHSRRSRAWLEPFIREPSTMLDTDGDARKLLVDANGVRMPDQGLAAGEVSKLIEMLARCSAKPCDLTPRFVPATTATPADFARGRNLFVGRELLKNGGPPCMSCHNVAGVEPSVGGGRLAKDLTHTFARLGDPGIDAALRNPAFALMNKVFADHPLESTEVFALRSFLYDSNRKTLSSKAGTLDLLLVGALGAVALLVVLNAVWARRLRGVRRTIQSVPRMERARS